MQAPFYLPGGEDNPVCRDGSCVIMKGKGCTQGDSKSTLRGINSAAFMMNILLQIMLSDAILPKKSRQGKFDLTLFVKQSLT